jgi:hypothetical protein
MDVATIKTISATAMATIWRLIDCLIIDPESFLRPRVIEMGIVLLWLLTKPLKPPLELFEAGDGIGGVQEEQTRRPSRGPFQAVGQSLRSKFKERTKKSELDCQAQFDRWSMTKGTIERRRYVGRMSCRHPHLSALGVAPSALHLLNKSNLSLCFHRHFRPPAKKIAGAAQQ